MKKTIEEKFLELEKMKLLAESLKARDNKLGKELAELENKSLVQ